MLVLIGRSRRLWPRFARDTEGRMFALIATSVADKFGVQPEHFQCEGDLVHGALAGAMTRREKFEVFNPIVVPHSVDVMDGLFGEQWSPDVLLHDHAVLTPVTLLSFEESGHVHADVPTWVRSFQQISVVEIGEGFRSLVGRFTDLVAKFLFFGVSRTSFGFVALHRVNFTALDACKNIACRGISLAARTRAFSRAVYGITPPFLAKRCYDAGFHGEWITALLADEVKHWHLRRLPTVSAFVSSLASFVTKLTTSVFRLRQKNTVAVLARQLDRHGKSPSLNKMRIAMSGILSQGEMSCPFPA